MIKVVVEADTLEAAWTSIADVARALHMLGLGVTASGVQTPERRVRVLVVNRKRVQAVTA